MDTPAAPSTPTPKPRLPWSVVHVIKNELYSIEISRLNLRLPKYSYKVLSITEDKKNPAKENGIPFGIPFISLTLEPGDISQGGMVRIRGKHPSEILYNLMQQAEEWVITTASLSYQEDRINRETEQANRDRLVTRQTGKTERERMKRVAR